MSASEVQKALLSGVAAEGGYVDAVVDVGAAETCVSEGWLMCEGAHGYALTLDGVAELRSGAESRRWH